MENPQVLALLKEVRDKPTYSVYQRLERQLVEFDGLANSNNQRRVRIAILSSFTIDPIKPYIHMGCLERNVWADVYIPEFNQFAQELLTPQSGLYSFNPDICFLQIPAEAIVDKWEPFNLQLEHVDDLIQSLSGYIRAFRDHCGGEMVVSNFSEPVCFPYSLGFNVATRNYKVANDRLVEVSKEIPGVHILDYEGLTAYHGKESVADQRWRHIARMELSHKFLPKLASKMLANVMALRGLGRKCVVLDLDNTLWGGVVGEDGPSGIQLGPDFPGSAFLEFQESLLNLHKRGILLAINSKNNESDALEVLAQHPFMVLRPEHFAAFRINWQDKCTNIESIASELNIGLDSMVFIDDSPVERELMLRLRPEVLTPKWPDDAVAYRTALEGMYDFAAVSVTEEDQNRGKMYAAEAQRERSLRRSSSLEEFLFGLGMVVTVSEADDRDASRVHQLVNKTNQFNLTARRYTSANVARFLSGEDVAAYVLRNEDVFGDNGLVGVGVVLCCEPHKEESTWRIDSLVMSCRVLGRTIEKGFLDQILQGLKLKRCRYVIGEFIPTSKNAMVNDFYSESGFVLLGTDDTSTQWILDLKTYQPPDLPWLKVNPLAG